MNESPDNHDIDGYEPPTEEYINKSLRNGFTTGKVTDFAQLTQDTKSGFSDVDFMLRKKGKLTREFIRLAFKYKNNIKSIPFVGKYALSVKRQLLRGNQPIQYSSQPIIDLSAILPLEINDFIRQLYLIVLGREPDVKGVKNSKFELFSGTPKEALIYSVCTSTEFANRAQVVNLDIYRKVFWKYRLRKLIKSLPLFGWFWSVLAIPRRINRLEIDERIRHADQITLDRQRYETLLSKLNTVQSKVDALDFDEFKVSILNTVQSKVDALDFDEFKVSIREEIRIVSQLLETTNQNIVYVNIKLDNTASLITDVASKQNKPVFFSFPGGVTIVKTKDYFFGVPSEEWRLAVFLNEYGFFEQGTEKFFRSILSAGMTALDVGANLGIYTLHALAAGCEVYSYEPTPRIYNILVDNVGINGFEPTGRANIFNLAVTDSDGVVDFAVDDNSDGQSNSLFAKNTKDQIIKVKTISLDKHLSHLSKVDVVKIDVEGAESLVLAGMRELIAKNPGIKIVMEFAPTHLKRGGVNPADFISTIRSYGLSIQLIDDITGELGVIDDENLCNVFSVNLLLDRQNSKTRG